MRLIILILFAITLFTSCTRHAYYQSPMYANMSVYRPIPLKRDSISSAIYANGALTLGGANEHLKDKVRTFHGSVHRSHNFGIIQAYYGITGAIGRYKVDSIYNPEGRHENYNLDDSLINRLAGNKTFRSYGGIGGINVVIPMGFGEWRVIGTELSWIKEYGQYLDFRMLLPDTAANIIERKRIHFRMAINTDFVFAIPDGSIGFKLAASAGSRKLRGYDEHRTPLTLTPGYFLCCLHFERAQYTGSFQFTSGDYALFFQGSFSVRLDGKGQKAEGSRQ